MASSSRENGPRVAMRVLTVAVDPVSGIADLRLLWARQSAWSMRPKTLSRSMDDLSDSAARRPQMTARLTDAGHRSQQQSRPCQQRSHPGASRDEEEYMFEIFGSVLETEIAYRRERLYDAAGVDGWKRPGGRWSRRSRAAIRPHGDGGRG